MSAGLVILIVIAVIVLWLVLSALRICKEYERLVVFFWGRFSGVRGPGLVFIVPFFERVERRVDMRILTMDVPAQEVITRDNVTLKVNAVIYFKVIDPQRAVINVANYVAACLQIAQTTLRDVVGQSELDELLAHRDQINVRLQTIIDEQTELWGIKVTIVAIKDVELPATMQRAMAKQAEAEREKRAKVIHAEGEFLAAKQLANAASVIGGSPSAMQLRYLQTLTEIAVEKNSTIIFPLPMELIRPFLQLDSRGNEEPKAEG
jgi:regulator of protease activity HflC (stomatin/prohibitin superfamily)